MSRSRSFVTAALGIVAVGPLLALAACAPEPQAAPTPTPTPTAAAPEPYAGPVHFVGDELDWFLPTAEQIAATIPGAGEISDPDANLQQVSDGWGATIDPEICTVLLYEASLGSIGARTITWTGAAGDGRDGYLHALQFADAKQTQAKMDEYLAAARACGQFTFDGHDSSYAAVVVDEPEGVQAIAAPLMIPGDQGEWVWTYFGISSVGNVIVEFWQPFTGEPSLDSAAAARLLADQAEAARDRLVETLTENPPVPREAPPAADPASAWSAWQIGFDAVGPLPLGEDFATVAAAVPGAEVIAPEGGIGDGTLVSPGGDARIMVRTQDTTTIVTEVRIGALAAYETPKLDGAALPRAGTVGVGDPVSAAMTAFPEGTVVHVISAGLDYYGVATRDGHVMMFHTDRDAADPEARIIGITAEDANLRRHYGFSPES